MMENGFVQLNFELELEIKLHSQLCKVISSDVIVVILSKYYSTDPIWINQRRNKNLLYLKLCIFLRSFEVKAP